MSIVMSLIGMAFLIFIAVLFSADRRKIRVRTVVGALCIQVAFGAFVMYVPIGQSILSSVAGGVQYVINYANEGLTFVFGDLANYKVGFVFIINVLCGDLCFCLNCRFVLPQDNAACDQHYWWWTAAFVRH